MAVAVISGGSRGIGLAIARELAARGFDLALGARTAAELESARAGIARDFGVRCLVRPTDVADPSQAEALIALARAELGRVDALVNNAGVNGAIGELTACAPAEWRQAFEVNVFGAAWLSRAAIAAMRAQGGGGKIVNLAGGGVGGPGVAARVSAYASSKAAVVQLTECLARELVADDIQVNAISPGAVVTEMTAAVIAAGPERAGRELYERTLQQRKAGGERPELAARLVAWLLSPASGKLTGKLLSAKWDDPGRLDVEAANKSSRFALRRIDDTLFREVPKG